MTQQTRSQTTHKPRHRIFLWPFLIGCLLFLIGILLLYLIIFFPSDMALPVVVPVVAISSQNMSQVVQVKQLDLNYRVALFAWSPDSSVLATGRERVIDLWNVDKGHKISSLAVEYFDRDMALSPDGTKLAVSRGSVTLYDVASGRAIQIFNGNVGNITFSPDGKWLAGGMNGVKAILWDTSNGIESRVFSDPLSRCQDASGTRPAFSPDSKILALGCSPSVTLWDMETGSLLSSLWADTYRVIRFMADGKMIATDNGILDITTGELHKWGGEYKQSVACWSISPDGSVEVFSYMPLPDFSFDQPQLTMRDLQGKHPVRELGPRACPISFSPDGRLLVFGSSPVRLWGVPP